MVGWRHSHEISSILISHFIDAPTKYETDAVMDMFSYYLGRKNNPDIRQLLLQALLDRVDNATKQIVDKLGEEYLDILNTNNERI